MKNKTKVFLGKNLLIIQIIFTILIFSMTFVYGTNIVWKIPLINNKNLNLTIQNKFKNLKFDCGENKYIQGFNYDGAPICNDIGNLSVIKKIDLKNNYASFGSGEFNMFFSKILNNCGDGMYVRGFDKNKNMICSNLSGSIFLFGNKSSIDNKLNINFPKNYPTGEFFGGKITKEFNNILNDCGENKYLQGFSSNGNIICSDLSKGVCGNSDGINTINYPTNGFCNVGNKIDIDVFGKDGTFNWNCVGILGIGKECIAKSKYDGICGKSNGKEFFSPPTSGLCDVGTSTLVTNDGDFTWKCSGLNGGLDSSCKAFLTGCIDIYDDWGVANGAPYSGGNQNYLFMDIEDKNGNQVCNEWRKDSVCQSTYDWIPSDGSISLKCNISNIFSWEEDDVVTCCIKKSIKTDGVCGKSNLQVFKKDPKNYLCEKGNPTKVLSTSTGFSWSCEGIDGGKSSTCEAYNFCSIIPDKKTIISGIENVNYSNIPISSCISGDGNICNENIENGEISKYKLGKVLCETKGYNCGKVNSWQSSYDGSAYFFNFSSKEWDLGLNKNTSIVDEIYCWDSKNNGVCGSSHGGDFLEKPNSNLCNYGISSDVFVNEKSYTWICKGFNGGDDSSCSANRQIQSICTGLPTNASWYSTNIVTQNWVSNKWTPESIGKFNIKLTDQPCTFRCIEGFTWNGKKCVK